MSTVIGNGAVVAHGKRARIIVGVENLLFRAGRGVHRANIHFKAQAVANIEKPAGKAFKSILERLNISFNIATLHYYTSSLCLCDIEVIPQITCYVSPLAVLNPCEYMIFILSP